MSACSIDAPDQELLSDNLDGGDPLSQVALDKRYRLETPAGRQAEDVHIRGLVAQTT